MGELLGEGELLGRGGTDLERGYVWGYAALKSPFSHPSDSSQGSHLSNPQLTRVPLNNSQFTSPPPVLRKN